MNSRAQLQMNFGDFVKVNCNNCGKQDKLHLNKISAVVDNRLILGGLICGIAIVVLIGIFFDVITIYAFSLWKVFAFSGFAISGLPFYFWNTENKAVGHFNRYAIKK
jgi:hypothetical protein